MPTHQEIKAEILQSIKVRYSDKKSLNDIIAKCEVEINRMTEVDGLDGKPVLEKFYSLWKSHQDKHGHENKINSWTAFCLGLTNKKPDGPFLPVRRAFARKGFPDIDLDFDYEFRGDLYNYIIERYNRENVSNTGTYQVLKLKSFVQRAVKALDVDRIWADSKEGKERWRKESNIKAREIVDSLPRQIGANLKVTDDTGEHAIKNTKDAVKYCRDFKYYIDKYPDILRHSEHIEGLLSSYGVHPSGICISSVPFSDIAPVRRSKIKTGVDDEGEQQYALATQYDYNDLESIGLIKFDVLALSTLTVIARTIKLVKDNYGIDIDIHNLPLNDKQTFQLYQSGHLVGVFQCENAGMQKTMKLIGVDRFEDIIAGVALYRPGPMASIPEYAARKKGEKRVEYFHPSVEPFVKPYLESTLGVLCYQEQVMQICNSLAGFSIGDGYAVIKAVGKKIQSLLDKYRSAFVAGCVKNKVPLDVGEKYWDKFITPFASYGFNKSHSAAYGFVSYQTAYLKAHYPEEFMISHLNVFLDGKKGNKYEKIYEFEKEMQRMGMEFLPKSINRCEYSYTIAAKRDVSQGIQRSQILPSVRCKGLSSAAAKNIVKSRPFKDMNELAFNTDPKFVDTTSIEALAEAGFFRDDRGRKRKTDVVVDEFKILRNDLKKVKSKGLESDDVFAAN